jgi:hypothetical protein
MDGAPDRFGLVWGGQATTTATADPYGMTNKRTNNGNGKGKSDSKAKTKATAKGRGKSNGKSDAGIGVGIFWKTVCLQLLRYFLSISRLVLLQVW